MHRLLFLAFLFAVSSFGAVTIYRIPGDYAATQAGAQSAVNACRSLNTTEPCVIEIAAGTDITLSTATLKLRGQCTALNTPDTGCTQAASVKRIIIRSSKVNEIPGRATVALASKMAKFTKTFYGNCLIEMPPGSPTATTPSHYEMYGLDVYDNSTAISYDTLTYGGLICIGFEPDAGNRNPRNYGEMPHHIIVDRSYIHGRAFSSWVTAGLRHGILGGIRTSGYALQISNNRVSDINLDYDDRGGAAENVGIGSSFGAGGWHIYNNHVEAAIGILAGGENPWTPGAIPFGYYVYANEVTRDPAIWHWKDWGAPALDTTKPCMTGSYYQHLGGFNGNAVYDCTAGAWVLNASPTRTRRNWIKNGIEAKNARHFVWEGNYVHDLADTGDQSQYAHAFLINHVDGDPGNAAAFHARPEHGIIRNNLVRQTGQGVVFGQLGTPYAPMQYFLVQNNLFDDMQSFRVIPVGLDNTAGGRTFELAQANKAVIERNTAVSARTVGGAFARVSHSSDMVLRNNFGPWHSSGYAGNGPASGEVCSAISGSVTGGLTWDYWALIDTLNTGAGLFGTYYSAAGCPANKQRVATWADVRFVNFNSGSGGDYRLCTGVGTPDASCAAASPLATAASDGGPLGADISQVNFATSGVSTGSPDAAWYEFQIRRLEEAGIRFTAYGTAACTWTIKNSAGTTVDSGTSTSGARDRSITPLALAAGEYTFRVTCDGGRYREQQFKAI